MSRDRSDVLDHGPEHRDQVGSESAGLASVITSTPWTGGRLEWLTTYDLHVR